MLQHVQTDSYNIPHVVKHGSSCMKHLCTYKRQVPHKREGHVVVWTKLVQSTRSDCLSRYPVVALQHQDGNGGRPQTGMLSWQFLEESVITWKVASSCHQLLVIWSFQSIAWLGFFGCIAGIAPELGYTVGS